MNTFRELIARHNDAAALETYLTSPDGGQLRCVSPEHSSYKIFRYVKGTTNLALPHAHWFRSVIWDTVSHLPVCVAPPKAEAVGVPTGEQSRFSLVQDFLEGTMINVFVTAAAPGQLQVATRTQLGAAGKFYSEKSFETLFEDALAAMGYSRESLLAILGTPSETVPFRFASLLLQHPEHRVVSRCRSPRLWLIHTGFTAVDGTVTIQEDVSSLSRLAAPSYPMTGFLTEKDLDSFFSGLVDTKGWFWQGLVFKDGFGKRWRMRNPNYIYLRGLRGSEATNVERFLRLRAESKVTEYLKHYSEERQTFWDLEQKLRTATQNVFQAYCEVHKSHEKKLADVAKPLQPCVFRLHSHFLEHLKPQNEKVQMKHAVELVNNMALFEQRRLLE